MYVIQFSPVLVGQRRFQTRLMSGMDSSPCFRPETTISSSPVSFGTIVTVSATLRPATGMIAGTYFNRSTNRSREIQGAVDNKTQRTAWTVGGDDWPVMETGISNLTEDESPALIHFANGQTQQWLMIRLQDPEGEVAN
jgi:hypothetical protein